MSNEEKYIREIAGTDNPFLVPDGYFEQLTVQVMRQLPERRPKRRLVSIRPWILSAAACVAAACVMGVTAHFHRQGDAQPVATANIENTYIDEAADYAMIDNAEIYACLSEN